MLAEILHLLFLAGATGTAFAGFVLFLSAIGSVFPF